MKATEPEAVDSTSTPSRNHHEVVRPAKASAVGSAVWSPEAVHPVARAAGW